MMTASEIAIRPAQESDTAALAALLRREPRLEGIRHFTAADYF
ncbi:hypothetical protein ACTU6U_13190 [Microbacterium sp. A196]